MSLTIISWCQAVHDVQVQVVPVIQRISGQPLSFIKSPWPCDPRTWTSGDRSMTGTELKFDLTGGKSLCMPRWALWGYQDRSSIGWSNRYWLGPTVLSEVDGQEKSGTLTYKYGGVEIIQVPGVSVYLGIIPNAPGGVISDPVGYAVNSGCPIQWASTFRTWIEITGYTPPSNAATYITKASYSVWELPDDLLVRDPVYFGGGAEKPQLGPIYGFAYDGPVVPGDIQEVTVEIDNNLIQGTYSSDPSVPLYFYAIQPPNQ